MVRRTMEMDAEALEERNRRFREFQLRVAAGNFDNLFESSIKQIIDQAAQEPDLDREIGIIRFLIVSLMHQEQDINKLVAGVARLTEAAVQATRIRRSQPGDSDAVLAEALNNYLALPPED